VFVLGGRCWQVTKPDGLALALFKTGILFVDHVEFPLAANDDAIFASLFDGRFDFHFSWVE